MNKTYSAKPHTLKRRYHVIDATDQTLGRLAVQVTELLRGKHKPEFTPHVDCGDSVIVINAEHIKVSGKKQHQKLYRRHSGRPGGMKVLTFDQMLQRDARRPIEVAVRGMLPHNRLGREQFKKLHVYAGASHPHTAQQPEVYTLKAKKEAK